MFVWEFISLVNQTAAGYFVNSKMIFYTINICINELFMNFTDGQLYH